MEATEEWDGLRRPYAGRLELFKPPGSLPRALRGKSLVPASVWLHCGVHYLERPPNEAAPSSGDMPPLVGADSHYKFFPLRRDKTDSPSSRVDVFQAASDGALASIAGRWVVELRGAGPSLLLCADSEEDARGWQKQVLMRLAPLTLVWSLCGPEFGDGSPTALAPRNGGGGATADAGAQGEPCLCSLATLKTCVGGLVSTDCIAGAADIATAVPNLDASNLAVAVGPTVGAVLSSLLYAVHVVSALRGMPKAVADWTLDVDKLCNTICVHLLPPLRDMSGDGGKRAKDLTKRTGELLADLEMLAGELLHLARSRRQRVLRACLSPCVRTEVGSPVDKRLSASSVTAAALGQQITSYVATKTENAVRNAPLDATLLARRSGPPELPPRVVVDWEDQNGPASQLYKAIMGCSASSGAAVCATPDAAVGAKTCAAVGAHGMGGVGKTVACQLVAHKIKDSEDGKARFSDSVYWEQLSSNIVHEKQVIDKMCSLASDILRKKVDAVDADVAVDLLRSALSGKACLVVVDDVWDSRWAALYSRAMHDVPNSCLLLSSRREDLLPCGKAYETVRVDKLPDAAAKAVLLAHAEPHHALADKSPVLVQAALDLCDGLALALSVVGSLVRDKQGWAPGLEWRHGRRLVNQSHPDYGTSAATRYETLWECLRESYTRLGRDGEQHEQWSNYFKALCVVRPKEQLPLPALAALWDVDERTAEEFARRLRDRSLVSLHGEEHGEVLRLDLHDLVVEYLSVPDTMPGPAKKRYHARLVDRYWKRHCDAVDISRDDLVSSAVVKRPLWKLQPDGYIEYALPHLLCGAGDGDGGREELRSLLFDMAYIAWRVKTDDGGCSLYRADVRRAGVAVLDRVATVVEGTVANRSLTLTMRMRQAAFELAERWRDDNDAGTVDGRMSHLSRTARSFVSAPSVVLDESSRLAPPLERRVLASASGARFVCPVLSAGGVNLLVTASRTENSLSVLVEDDGSRLAKLDGHTDVVSCVAVVERGGNGSGARVVSGSDDSSVRVWDVDGKEPAVVLEGHTGWVMCVAVVEGVRGGSGARVVSGSDDSTVRVWDVDGKEPTVVLEGHTGPVTCVAVVEGVCGGSGARVVSGSDDSTVRVWDIGGGPALRTLAGVRDAWVYCAVLPSTAHAFTPAAVVERAVSSGARRAPWRDDAGLLFIGQSGCTAIVDSRMEALRHLPCPPGVLAVCCPAPGCVAWGTKFGRVFCGRLSL